ncbi:MAG: hypothetical protein L6Q97_13045 [Thermoanaerobaculia bacterium]|nr:hypothetical protein [Thermoanaerobaculia bacterium]
MKIICYTAFLLAATLLGSQCKHTKYTPESLPEDRLLFGEGGGFAGIETTYTLLENGQLFKFDSKAPGPLEIAGTKKKTANRLFETAESLGLLTLDFKHPGNVYQFIEFQDDGKKSRIVWGDKEHAVDPKIADLHRQLMQIADKAK